MYKEMTGQESPCHRKPCDFGNTVGGVACSHSLLRYGTAPYGTVYRPLPYGICEGCICTFAL